MNAEETIAEILERLKLSVATHQRVMPPVVDRGNGRLKDNWIDNLCRNQAACLVDIVENLIDEKKGYESALLRKNEEIEMLRSRLIEAGCEISERR